MTPSSQPRKRRNSSRVNLLISVGIHALIVLAVVYFAAREGVLGKRLKTLAVQMVKEPVPEKPKPEEKPKDEPPKIEAPKLDVTPKIAIPKEAPAPMATSAASAVAAPAPVDVGGFEFDGGRATTVAADPVATYRGLVQNALRARWERPSDMDDLLFVAEVEVDVDQSGQIGEPVWKRGSGNKRWDDSVKAALAATRSLPLPPPKNFPSHVLVRFDVTMDSQSYAP
jgi:outer membrane biosynthesis protein TonB